MTSLALSCPAVRRLGILTAGGDCPGLNAVIRAVVRNALRCEMEVVGIADGFVGLIEDRCRELREADISGILNTGGTILGSNNKANPARYAVGKDSSGAPIFRDVTSDCLATLVRHRVEALIMIGGDGSHSAAMNLARKGVPIIGVPKTIDNDIVGTEMTFGFQTAVTTAATALDQVRTTADSHHRAMVVEVMGRNAGWIALHAGLASGSEIILLPEIPFAFEKVCERVVERSTRGKRASLICVSEGAMMQGGQRIVARTDATSADPVRLGGIGKFLADKIEDATGVESRYVILGHTQRGGSPVPADRVLGTLFGSHAMRLLAQGKTGRMVALQQGALTDVDIATPADKQRLVPMDDPHVLAAIGTGVMFGG